MCGITEVGCLGSLSSEFWSARWLGGPPRGAATTLLRRGGGPNCCGQRVCNTREPPGRPARQGEERPPTRAGPTGGLVDGAGHHQPEHTARAPRLPRPNQPPPLTEPAYTETLTGSRMVDSDGRARLASRPRAPRSAGSRSATCSRIAARLRHPASTPTTVKHRIAVRA